MNPGSTEAVAEGCTCAVLDNHHGRRAPCPPDDWWVTVGCPLHAPVATVGQSDETGNKEDEAKQREVDARYAFHHRAITARELMERTSP